MSLHVPRAFANDDRAAATRLMHDHPFATLVTAQGDDPLITHLPLVHVADCEPHGTLLGHFGRANPHAAAAGRESVAVFHGPHAYVSPSWYGSPATMVPTWNYAVVHAHGTLELARDPASTRAILDHMVQRFEAHRAAPWQVAMEASRLASLVDAIVGFRLRIRRMDVKFKLSQNRSPDDRARVAKALAAEGDDDAAATARWMQAYGDVPNGPA